MENEEQILYVECVTAKIWREKGIDLKLFVYLMLILVYGGVRHCMA